ncbi:hypothetical protein KCU83_g566, partial [Aureobasidium melanogenum]
MYNVAGAARVQKSNRCGQGRPGGMQISRSRSSSKPRQQALSAEERIDPQSLMDGGGKVSKAPQLKMFQLHC